jgi:hypothetical protein
VTLVSWLSFHHSTFKYLRFLSAPICVNHLSTFKYPVDPVDPVIRILFQLLPACYLKLTTSKDNKEPCLASNLYQGRAL